MKGYRLIDLSLPLKNGGGFGAPAKMNYVGHRERANLLVERFGVTLEDLAGKANAMEEFSYLHTHCGTHFDAPWHYTDEVDGQPAMTIDQVPLQWCFGDGIMLDLSWKKAGEDITAEELAQAAQAAGCVIKPFDIVLIRTGTSDHYGQEGCDLMNPGVTREATHWLADQGVKLVGIDAGCWDRPPQLMINEIKDGIKGKYMQGHRAAGERGLCILEWLTDLHLLPASGFKVFAFPVKVERAGGGWVRAVALVDELPAG